MDVTKIKYYFLLASMCMVFFGINIIASASLKDMSSIWQEAEDYVLQKGSTEDRCAMSSASGGYCVDNNWGSHKGDLLQYKIALPTDYVKVHILLRYARASDGHSVLRLRLDHDDEQSVDIRPDCTGDWGFDPKGWRYVEAVLPKTLKGEHILEIISEQDKNNINLDGFYLSSAPIKRQTSSTALFQFGPDKLTPIGQCFPPLYCKTPLAMPFSTMKGLVHSNGLIETYPPGRVEGMRRKGPHGSLHVVLADHGPWEHIDQRFQVDPIPTIITRFVWSEVEMEQSVFAAAPDSEGWWMRVRLVNKSNQKSSYRIFSQIQPVSTESLLRVFGDGMIHTTPLGRVNMPGPLGNNQGFIHQCELEPGKSLRFDLRISGQRYDSWEQACQKTVPFWQEYLKNSTQVHVPDPLLQYAFDVALRQVLAMIERHPDEKHARILKGMQHYYGANPYDTFQGSRALDSVGLRYEAEELLRHQIDHLRDFGVFEMWERNALHSTNVDQWIVQGLAAEGMWRHYDLWKDPSWLLEMAPALIKAAQATLAHIDSNVRQQGGVEISGWLPPLGGDGGLPVAVHFSQNAGPLAGVRWAAKAARLLNRPEADELQKGYEVFQKAYDKVLKQSVQASEIGIIPAYPGAEGINEEQRHYWGVVMSVTAFGAILPDGPGAINSLRFLQYQCKENGLHHNLGYSPGVWPYMSAEVAQWHMMLGEHREAWRILQAIVAHASPTVCWYEEQSRDPLKGKGYCDPADVWAAAEMVYLTRQLLINTDEEKVNICLGMPPEWMRPGHVINVEHAPTSWGKVSFGMTFSEDNTQAIIRLSAESTIKKIKICLLPSKGSPYSNLKVEGAVVLNREGRNFLLGSPNSQIKIILDYK